MSFHPSETPPHEIPLTESQISEESAASALKKQSKNPWPQVALLLKDMVREHVFERWFRDAHLNQEEDGSWVLSVPSETHCLWIETNFMPELCSALDSTIELGEAAKVRVRAVDPTEVSESDEVYNDSGSEKASQPMEGELFERSVKTSSQPTDFARRLKQARLNPDNNFERFVVGSSNEFAHAASLAVAQGRGGAYNPLFIHGDSGMGKTHLTQALGQEFLKSSPQTKVVYLTCERFTNEFIDAVQKGSLDRFRNNYRRANVLIVDDVQFLNGKEKTGDEFFHTFNALLDLQAQIILTSDRPACEIQSLEPRLISRFESGLTVALQPPSLEMRIALLQKKMDEWKVKIPHEFLVYIAERVKSNVRRLEGALVRVATYCSLGSGNLTQERVEVLLKDILREEASRKVTIDSIQRKVADFYDLRISDMTSRRRPKNIAHARQVAMYLSREMTKNSLVEIGEAFGGRDHGTIIHACKRVKNLLNTEEETKQAVDLLATQLNR